MSQPRLPLRPLPPSFNVPREFLMLVKTYPSPSTKYGETVCCAGIDTTSGRWVRIFPVNFRRLGRDEQFKKWQFIRATYREANDPRPESIRIFEDSIEAGEPIPPREWPRRRAYTDPLVVPSVEALIQANSIDGTSLGVIRPRSIDDFLIEQDDPFDDESERERKQLEIEWADAKLPQSDLEKLPFRFRYRFRCADIACATTHNMVILDWEIAQAYRRWRVSYGDPGWRQKLREKYFETLPRHDIHLILGTHHRFGSWMIVGVFAIPHQKVGEQDRRIRGHRRREEAPVTGPWVELETEQGDRIGDRPGNRLVDGLSGAVEHSPVSHLEEPPAAKGERSDALLDAQLRSRLIADASLRQATLQRAASVARAPGSRRFPRVDDERHALGKQRRNKGLRLGPLVADRECDSRRHVRGDRMGSDSIRATGRKDHD